MYSIVYRSIWALYYVPRGRKQFDVFFLKIAGVDFLLLFVVGRALTLVQQPRLLFRLLGAVLLLPAQRLPPVQLHVVGVDGGGDCVANAAHLGLEDLRARARRLNVSPMEFAAIIDASSD